jgi:hypothetical protein
VVAGPSVNVRDLNGSWQTTFGTAGDNTTRFGLTQSGTTLSGTMNHTWANSSCRTNGERIVSGSVAAGGKVAIRTAVPTVCSSGGVVWYNGTSMVNYDCTLANDLNSCAGTVTEGGSFSYSFTMRR